LELLLDDGGAWLRTCGSLCIAFFCGDTAEPCTRLAVDDDDDDDDDDDVTAPSSAAGDPPRIRPNDHDMKPPTAVAAADEGDLDGARPGVWGATSSSSSSGASVALLLLLSRSARRAAMAASNKS